MKHNSYWRKCSIYAKTVSYSQKGEEGRKMHQSKFEVFKKKSTLEEGSGFEGK